MSATEGSFIKGERKERNYRTFPLWIGITKWLFARFC